MKENNKYRFIWAAIGLLLVLNIGLLAWIMFFSANGFFPPKRLFLENELKFDQKQSDAYRILRQQHAAQVRALRETVKSMKTEFYEELSQENISDSTIKSKAINIETKMAEVDLITFKHFQQVRRMCTPQQQKRFDELIMDLIRTIDRPSGGPPPRNARPPFDGPRPSNMPPPNE
ncbi:hypothetical protein EMA8858_03779 [Emticicia aquatica]|uniref:Periplasmic heavy metal sensor n=1 Tax=Emticicia aquatica TaxID=1681835 RepID=A0ABM9AVD4_9BACT|nr:hypothetical protein [Emticicia aquatica]CAH0997645.1 hypothetical protein EMA8858_03779 [Emticicia aquatica]